MFGIGLSEAVVLGIIILILLGPKQLPEILRGAGKLFREISKARQEFNQKLDQDDEYRNIRESVREVKQSIEKPLGDIRSSVEKELKNGDKPHG
jgi:sec-independent protein translocase protein TatB